MKGKTATEKGGERHQLCSWTAQSLTDRVKVAWMKTGCIEATVSEVEIEVTNTKWGRSQWRSDRLQCVGGRDI